MSPPVPRQGRLAVYLEGELLGLLEDRTLGYVAFTFAEETVERHGAGSRILSVGIPVGEETVDPLIATPFFAGLLPEGDVLDRIAAEFRIDPGDTYGLLAVLGRECAGALVLIPKNDAPPSEGEVRWLDEAALAEELQGLTDSPLGVSVDDDSVRLSLAGAQDKLPVVIDGERVGLPLHGHASTHILKPASVRMSRRGDLRFPELVANEAFCLALAAQLGIPAAAFSVMSIADEHVLSVERYDRIRDDGRIQRIHQEDSCQALRIHPQHKYESGGGPSLARVAQLLNDVSTQPLIDRRTLYRLALLNVLIGNADAHGKNISLLHDAAGIRLAPAYDLVATQIYNHPETLGMSIGGAQRLRDVDRNALIAAGADCGFTTQASQQLLDEQLAQLDDAIAASSERARSEGWWADRIDQLIAGVHERSALL